MSIYFTKIRLAITTIILTGTVILSMSFSREKYTKTPVVISNLITEVNNAMATLDASAQDYRAGKISLDSLRSALNKTRLSYKKAEFYLAYHYNEYVLEHINGAPLLHIEKSGTSPVVLTPEGLQVLDELIFSEDAPNEKVQISALSKKVNSHYNLLYSNLLTNKLLPEGNIAAMRLQLVRMYSLGLTGFDTPGSLNALPEAVASLQGMKSFFVENYNSDNGDKIPALIDGCIAYLSGSVTFENLDRLYILKTYIDPLYAALGKIEGAKEIESLKSMTAWNADSSSIFGNDFLDPYFFSDLKKEEDSEALRLLGKTLFYDPAVSGDNTMSCASCHNPEKAFADGVPKSVSNLQGKTVLRNAPTLINAVYADRYFYDLRAFTLEQQAEHVIFNPEEFNTAYSAILAKLEKNKEYAAKFRSVFGKGKISREWFSKALASYVLSLRSFNSPFDRYVRGEESNLSQEAKNGFNLFMGKANCATCHFAPTFAGLVPPLYNENESEILGVLADPSAKSPATDVDGGRWSNGIQSEYAWIYEKSFKTTTVRNAALTAPYFHNGAYKTLEEVIDFYNNGGGGGLGLNIINQTLPTDALNLTQKEKSELIAFITSLNDVPSEK